MSIQDSAANSNQTNVLSEETIKRYRANQGYVYLVHAVGTDRYKIGQSTQPKTRFEQLKKQSPYPLEIIGCFWTPDRLADEATLHDYFCEGRVHGEWFEFANSIDIQGMQATIIELSLFLKSRSDEIIQFGWEELFQNLVYQFLRQAHSLDELLDRLNALACMIVTTNAIPSIGERSLVVVSAFQGAIESFDRYYSFKKDGGAKK